MAQTAYKLNLPGHFKNRKALSMDPFFPVEEVPMIRKDTGEETGDRYLVHGENRSILGRIVDPAYNLTLHETAEKAITDVISSLNLDFSVHKRSITHGGSRFFSEILFPGLSINPANGNASTASDAKGLQVDSLIPSIVAMNSYDKTSKLSWAYRMYRLRCKNGMSTLQKETSVSFKHNQVVNMTRVKDTLMGGLEESSNLINHVYAKLNSEEGLLYLDKVLASDLSDKVKKLALDKLGTQLNMNLKETVVGGRGSKQLTITDLSTTASAWEVYNTLTYVSTHSLNNAVERMKADKSIAKLFQVSA